MGRLFRARCSSAACRLGSVLLIVFRFEMAFVLAREGKGNGGGDWGGGGWGACTPAKFILTSVSFFILFEGYDFAFL